MSFSPRLTKFLNRPLTEFASFRDGLRQLPGRAASFAGKLLKFAWIGFLVFNTAVPAVRSVQVMTAGPELAITLNDALGQKIADASLDMAHQLRTDPKAAEAKKHWGDMTVPQKIALLEDYQARFLKHFPGVPDNAILVDTERFAGSYAHVDNSVARIFFSDSDADLKKDPPSLNVKMNEENSLTSSLLGGRTDFDTTISVLIHETIHTVQISYVASAYLSQLEFNRPSDPALRTTDAAIEALRPLTGTVKVPRDMQRMVDRLFDDSLDVVKRLKFGYYLNSLEQQAFKGGDCMAAAIKAPASDFDALTPQALKATFLACGENYRPHSFNRTAKWVPVNPALTIK